METKLTNIDALIERLPEGYVEASQSTKALERKREIKSAADLIRLVLLYLTGEYSQIEISILAGRLGIAEISDVAFLKRFSKCRKWLEWIVANIIPKPIIEYTLPKGFEDYTVVALDGSTVSEKGRSGRIFRLHYAIDLMKMCALSYKITAQSVGEKLTNFHIFENWLILADRAYGTLTSIEHCLKAKANFIFRLKYNAFKLCNEDGSELDLLEKLQDATSEIAVDIEAYVKLSCLGFTKVRVCVIRKPDGKFETVYKKIKRKASKKQVSPSVGSFIMEQYVVVITALPPEIRAYDILSLYRFRWQIEIYFKRLKSILDFGNIPLKKEDSIYTWLNGKLLVALLIEQMLSEVSFPPQQKLSRSLWREIRFIYCMIKKNILALGSLLGSFARISSFLHVEKRRKRCELQMARL